MISFSQGDVIKIEGLKDVYLVVSNNKYIKATKLILISPIIKKAKIDPTHIFIQGKNNLGFVLCEQIKLIDPVARNCNVVDRISYDQIMNISDAIQGIFEYD